MKIKAGIIGGAGYTAGELIRILLHHKEVFINFIYSTSNSGNKVSAIHQDLVGDTDLVFTSKVNLKVDVLFLCLGHGNSKTTEIHTSVSTKSLANIKRPLDPLLEIQKSEKQTITNIKT